MVELTEEALTAGVGCSVELAALWLEPMKAACAEFELNVAPERIAAFLAAVGAASEGLTSLVERTNLTAEELCQTWPFRYSVDMHVAFKVPNSTAYLIGGDPVKVANHVYANRLGNGREGSGDGWRYRGRGPLRVTGRGPFTAFLAACKLPPDTDPAALELPRLGSLSAAWVFSLKPLNVIGYDGDTMDRYSSALSALASTTTKKLKEKTG